MEIKDILLQLNIKEQCKKYNVPLNQCPHFLFVIMGLAICIFAVTAYVIGVRYVVDPQIIAIGILVASIILLIITFFIIQGFEKVAEASRLKTEFINIVSHQLRTPITNMRWSIDTLLSGRMDHVAEKQQEYFKILSDNTLRMNELVQDLLMVSRIEQGRLPVRAQELLVPDFIRETLTRFEQIAKTSDIGLNFTINSDILKISTDASHLKIILENFIQNAIRYSKHGEKVDINLMRRNNELRISVKDGGIGINHNDQKFIFQKFFRTDAAKIYQPSGTGLGLYITKMLITGLKGKVGFTSQENKGSTFWFTLPIK